MTSVSSANASSRVCAFEVESGGAPKITLPAADDTATQIRAALHSLLRRLTSQLQSIPPLEGRGKYGDEQYSWLGQANALMQEWDENKSIPFKAAVNGLIQNTNRPGNFGTVVVFFYDVIASVEHSLPPIR